MGISFLHYVCNHTPTTELYFNPQSLFIIVMKIIRLLVFIFYHFRLYLCIIQVSKNSHARFLSLSLFIFIPESFVSLSRACVFPVFLSASPEVTKACWWRNGRKYEEGEVKRCFVYLYSTSPTLTYTYSSHVVLFPLFIFKLPLLVLSLSALSIFFHLSCSIQ